MFAKIKTCKHVTVSAAAAKRPERRLAWQTERELNNRRVDRHATSLVINICCARNVLLPVFCESTVNQPETEMLALMYLTQCHEYF